MNTIRATYITPQTQLLGLFDAYLNERNPIITIAGTTYEPAEVLRAVNPKSYMWLYHQFYNYIN